MSCNNNRCSSYFTNLASAARQNYKEKYTVVQGDYLKVNVMSVPMCGEIGVEVHEDEDQLITIVCGTATVKLGNTRGTADCVRRLNAGDSVLIPAGTWHNVCNTGNGQLQLVSVYAYGNNTNRGCTQTRVPSGTQRTNCGCAQTTATVYEQTANTGCSNVFNAGNYNWNSKQFPDNACSYAIDSGC